jgi:phosphoglucosamine mutase
MVQTPSRQQTYPLSAHAIQLAQTLTLPNTPLFGTDGIRGKVGDLLTASLALQVGFWAGEILRENAGKTAPIILGEDSRNSSEMLSRALSEGLTAAGLEVWNVGLCPTPCVSFLTSVTDAIGGVMISASHNPPEDNGIKFFGKDGTKLPTALQEKIEAGIRQSGNLSIIGEISSHHHRRPELVEEYAESLHRPIASEISLKGMRIVLDLAWGAAVQIAPRVFREMGAEVICLHDQPDGDRINVNCGSTHLQLLKDAVKFHNADIGFAFDGDADRALAVDHLGRPIDGDYILYLWGRKLRQKGMLPGDLIISTVMANLGFENAWKALGCELIRTPVGDQYVHGEMKRTGAMLGGEQSGHILCPHYAITGDGVLTALQLAVLVKESGFSLAELVDQSFQTYPQLLINVRVEDREKRLKWHENEKLQNAIAHATNNMGTEGRVLVRASGTEPLIRVMVEASCGNLVKEWADHLVLAVQQHLGV